MRTLFIGDSHGKFTGFLALAKFALENYSDIEQIVSVGDFGIWDFTALTNPFSIPVRFIDGNHECFPMIHSGEYRKNFVGIDYIPRGTIESGILYCGGASSLYKGKIGIDWFDEENISYREFNEIMDKVEEYIRQNGEGSITKMVCHDTIVRAYPKLIQTNHNDSRDANASALQEFFELIGPSSYVHGHHHISMKYYETTPNDDLCEFHSLNMCGGFGKENKIEIDPSAYFNECCVILSHS
jgi:hypothetical protein